MTYALKTKPYDPGGYNYTEVAEEEELEISVAIVIHVGVMSCPRLVCSRETVSGKMARVSWDR